MSVFPIIPNLPNLLSIVGARLLTLLSFRVRCAACLWGHMMECGLLRSCGGRSEQSMVWAKTLLECEQIVPNEHV